MQGLWSYVILCSFILIVIAIYLERNRWSKLYDGLKILLYGVLLLFAAILIFAWSSMNIDLKLFWLFLTLRNSISNVATKLLVFSYLLILVGLEIIVIVLINKTGVVQSKESSTENVIIRNSPPERTVSNNNQGVNQYTNAMRSESLIQTIGLVVVASSPLLLIYIIVSQGISPNNKYNNIYIGAIVLFGFLFFIVIGLMSRYLLLEVTVKQNGIVFRKLFREISLRWDEILEIKKVKGITGEAALVKTTKGEYSFGPTMKIKRKEFPKLTKNHMGIPISWSMPDNSIKEVTIENCELFNEIRSRLIELTSNTKK